MFGLHKMSSLLESSSNVHKFGAKIHSVLLVLGNIHILCSEQLFFMLELISSQHGITFVAVVEPNVMKGSISSMLQ